MTLADEATLPRAELDRDYTARATVTTPEFEATIARYLALSQVARDLPDTLSDLIFDPATGLRLDLFNARPGALRPCVIFVHGGYWRALSKEHSAFMAPMLAAKGIATAVPDYRLAPAASMTDIVGDMRRALAWLWAQAPDLGIDRGRLVAVGSSAGGHLVGAMASPGWQAAAGLPPQPLKAILPVSGLFDLAAIAASHVQDWMRLSPAEVAAFSPLRHPPEPGLPGVVALAAGEAAGFLRQSRAYADATGLPLLEIPGRHHFDVVLDLADPDSALSAHLLRLIGQ